MTNAERLAAVATLRNLNHSIALLDNALSPEGKTMQAELVGRANVIHQAIAVSTPLTLIRCRGVGNQVPISAYVWQCSVCGQRVNAADGRIGAHVS